MLGAVLGDIIGSPYEFDKGEKTKDFPLFGEKSRFTDDSVMTVAVGKAFLDIIEKEISDEEEMKSIIAESMRTFGRKYPHAGYGGRFRLWLRDETMGPYRSFGNGSAMRVSSASQLFDTIEDVRRASRISAVITHDHPEGIKGAEATASAAFLARKGFSKREIKTYIQKEFGYSLNRSLSEIRPGYHFDVTCMGTVPEAVEAFLEGKNFEDVIRNAVSLGGDTDTLAAIAGSIAEGRYSIPKRLLSEAYKRLPKELSSEISRFEMYIYDKDISYDRA